MSNPDKMVTVMVYHGRGQKPDVLRFQPDPVRYGPAQELNWVDDFVGGLRQAISDALHVDVAIQE